MVKQDFLEQLCFFMREELKDFVLEVSIQRSGETVTYRAPEVLLWHVLSDSEVNKKVPYVINQIIGQTDGIDNDGRPYSVVQVRSICCIYTKDAEEGCMVAGELTDRIRYAFLTKQMIAPINPTQLHPSKIRRPMALEPPHELPDAYRYMLDLKHGNVETYIYPDKTTPYYAAEVVSAWKVPSLERWGKETK